MALTHELYEKEFVHSTIKVKLYNDKEVLISNLQHPDMLQSSHIGEVQSLESFFNSRKMKIILEEKIVGE